MQNNNGHAAAASLTLSARPNTTQHTADHWRLWWLVTVIRYKYIYFTTSLKNKRLSFIYSCLDRGTHCLSLKCGTARTAACWKIFCFERTCLNWALLVIQKLTFQIITDHFCVQQCAKWFFYCSIKAQWLTFSLHLPTSLWNVSYSGSGPSAAPHELICWF